MHIVMLVCEGVLEIPPLYNKLRMPFSVGRADFAQLIKIKSIESSSSFLSHNIVDQGEHR